MNESLEDLLAVYALGGLSSEEAAQVEAYIAENPAAAAKLRTFYAAVSLLPYAADPIEPSAGAEQALLARVDLDLAAQPRPDRETAVSPKRSPQTKPGLWVRLQAFFNTPFVTAASLAAVALILFWSLSLNRQVRNLNQSVTQLMAENGGLQADVETLVEENEALNGRVLALEAANQALNDGTDEMAQLNAELIATNNSLQSQVELAEAIQSELVTQINALEGQLAMMLAAQPFNSPDIYSVTIPGTELQPDASAQLVIDPVYDTALLVVSGMPELPEDAVYQVLLIRGTEHETAETFRVDTEGDGVLLVHSEEPLRSFDTLGVSIEPEGGSLQRTGDIVLLGSLIN